MKFLSKNFHISLQNFGLYFFVQNLVRILKGINIHKKPDRLTFLKRMVFTKICIFWRKSFAKPLDLGMLQALVNLSSSVIQWNKKF